MLGPLEHARLALCMAAGDENDSTSSEEDTAVDDRAIPFALRRTGMSNLEFWEKVSKAMDDVLA